MADIQRHTLDRVMNRAVFQTGIKEGYIRRCACLFFFGLMFMGAFAIPLRAADFTVTTTTDSQDAIPGDGLCADGSGACSLRAAVMEANALAGNDQINVAAGTYALTITNTEDYAFYNDLDVIGNTLTIIGAGTGASVIIDASLLGDRVFEVHNGATLTLNNLTVTGGYPNYGTIEGGGIRVASGGILNLDHVIVTENEAAYGGGIYNAGTITGTLVSITSNTASGASPGGMGGGIHLVGSANNSVTLTRSLIAGNTCVNYGGGILNAGNGSYGSPVGGNLRLENVTISGNTADVGGGVHLQQGSSAYFVNCTIANNANASSSSGAGLLGNGAPAFDFLNTLVINNTNTLGVNNCYQVHRSTSESLSDLNSAYFDQNVPFGYNICDDGSCGNFTADSNVLLEASLTTLSSLAGVGTYRLQIGSSAIDTGDPVNYPSADVFGITRPQGDIPDIGAYEYVEEPEETPVVETSHSDGGWCFISTASADAHAGMLALCCVLAMVGLGIQRKQAACVEKGV